MEVDDTNDDVQIIAEETVPRRMASVPVNNSTTTRRRRRLVRASERPGATAPVPPQNHVIDVEELPSDEEEDIQIVEERNIARPTLRTSEPPLPPPNAPPPGEEVEYVVHAPGRTFPAGRVPRYPQRSFAGMRPAMTTRIRSRQELERSYQTQRLRDRRRAQLIRERFYRLGNNVNERIWGMLPQDLSLGLGNILFPGNINNLFFRNEDSETDEDYSPLGRASRAASEEEQERRETEFWINRVQQLENLENDERIRKRMKYAENCQQVLLKRQLTSETQDKLRFFNTVKKNMKPVCVQCGVELGEGIPGDYQLTQKSQTRSLEELIKLNRIPAPYQYTKSSFKEVDMLNSKKIFFSKNCGHLYCGRCIQMFSKSKGKLNKLKKVKVYVNETEFYEIYENGEPILNLKRCCGFQCNANLHKFYEIYF